MAAFQKDKSNPVHGYDNWNLHEHTLWMFLAWTNNQVQDLVITAAGI